jgi:hypothetical protein
MPDADHRLTAAEIAAYERDGFVVPRFALTGDRLKKLQGLATRLMERNPHIAEGMIGSPHLLNGSGTQKVETEEGWLDIATTPEILDMLEQIVGPDLVLWTSTVFYKRPKEGPATPWHRDGAFYPIRPLATTTVWIAAFESVKENACLRFITGSHETREVGRHKDGHWRDSATGGALPETEFDERKAVDVELQPGQMVIFDVYSVHGSRPNLGDRARAGFAVRFFPATSYYDHDAPDEEFKVAGGVRGRQLILVRGRDRASNRFGDVSAVVA